MNLRIFLFHRISPGKEKWAFPMSPGTFDKCIKYITKNFQVRTVEDVFLSNEQDDTRPTACITFDDGFKDNIEYAAPILKKYNCPASFYVVTDSIDNNIIPWTHIYNYIFLETGSTSLKIKSEYLKEFESNTNFTSVVERNLYAKRLFQKIQYLPYFELQNILTQLYNAFNDISLPQRYMMSWENINELKNGGFYIGSHTHTHPLLSTIENDDQLINELKYSAFRIYEKTGDHPVSISYPVGNYDERVKNMAKAVGYKIGLAVNQQAFKKSDDIFEIPRIDLYADAGWTKTFLRLNGSMEIIKRFMHYG